MNPSDYRREYAAYCSALALARFKRHAGLAPQLDLRPAEERYADLWTREVINDLRRALEETPAHFETERAGLRALVGTAQLKHAEESTREVSEEFGRCAESARVEWGGARLAADNVPELMAAETDAGRRRELARYWFDAVRACDDLRVARLEALDAATRALGFDSRREFYESFTGADLEQLAAAASAFLARTEAAYMSRLARWAARELPAGAPTELHYADQLFLARAARLDSYFPAQTFRALYRDAFNALGLRVESQPNLLLDAEPRPSKAARSACFAVEPPDDVRLALGASPGGINFYGQSLRESGRAQALAWASRDAAKRYPEFVHAPDAATQLGHGLLLIGLFRDGAWLAEHRGVRATEAQEIVNTAALIELYETRRECAALSHALAVDGARIARSEQLDEEYAALFGGATGFRHDAATRLFDADEGFRSASSWRARLFAAGFAEHLRVRHGRRWFASRAAGDELIDVWNTASRHSVEQLARLVWGGEPSFDLLADVLLAALKGGEA